MELRLSGKKTKDWLRRGMQASSLRGENIFYPWMPTTVCAPDGSNKAFESWNQIHKLAWSMGMRNASGRATAGGWSDLLKRIGSCFGMTSPPEHCTGVPSGNRTTPTMEP